MIHRCGQGWENQQNVMRRIIHGRHGLPVF
jgi:hypothetical protein